MILNPRVVPWAYSRTFVSGTLAQQAKFDAALAASSFPWQRLGVRVRVHFTDDPAPAEHFEVAWTTFTPNTVTDWVDLTDEIADVKIANGLTDPQSPLYQGEEFFTEVVVHEMAHILIAQLDPSYAEVLCGMFGAPASAWNPPVTDHDSWRERVIESVAETFKDLYLARDLRKYDNRTKWRLREGRLQDFYDVIETVYAVEFNKQWIIQAGGLGTPFTNPTDGKDYVAIDMAFSAEPQSTISALPVTPILFGMDHRLTGEDSNPGPYTTASDPADWALSDWYIKMGLIDAVGDRVAFEIPNPNAFDMTMEELTAVGDPPYLWYAVAEGDMPYFALDGPAGSTSWNQVVNGQGAFVAYLKQRTQPVLPRKPWPYPAAVMGIAKSPVGTIRRGYRGA